MFNSPNLLSNLKQSSIIIILLCAVVFLIISQHAYVKISEFKIVASYAGEGDQFETSISISGDYSVVGANLDKDNIQ